MRSAASSRRARDKARQGEIVRCGTLNRTSKLGMIFVCTGAVTKLLLAGLDNRTFGTTPLSLSRIMKDGQEFAVVCRQTQTKMPEATA